MQYGKEDNKKSTSIALSGIVFIDLIVSLFLSLYSGEDISSCKNFGICIVYPFVQTKRLKKQYLKRLYKFHSFCLRLIKPFDTLPWVRFHAFHADSKSE